MQEKRNCLSDISMVTANFGEGVVIEDVIQDWFNFLGGKPAEVIVIDCGSDSKTQATCWKMFQKGMIDKLQLIHPDNDDFGKDKGYIKEYTAGAVATKPYVLTFKTDTLPYRQGQEGWLEEALAYLDREEVFALSGAWNLPAMDHQAWPGWYFSKKCSYNFALMKRSMFMAAAHEFGHEFILSGFKGENPAIKTGFEEYGELANQDRYFVEVAFEKYLQHHNLYALSKVEDPNWTVFHTNVHDDRLKQVREEYLARQDIEKFMNVGFSDRKPDPSKSLHYGIPPESVSLVKRVQVALGNSVLGGPWRSLKKKLRHS